MSNLREDPLAAVRSAIAALGGRSPVIVEVTRVEIEDRHIRMGVTLHHQHATPACCGEPGCYVAFLGLKRRELPAALARALDLPDEPAVSISVLMEHPPGYEYREGIPARAVDCTIEYDPSHFAGPT